MKKIKTMYYDERGFGSCSTGIIIELEDGTVLKECSTDPVRKWNKITIAELKNYD